MATRKTAAEWEKIEREYLAGEASIREIADRHEISEAAIRKRAKEKGWAREVRRRKPVRTLLPVPRPAPTSPMSPPAPIEPVAPREPLATAEIADHARQLVARMLDELDAVTSHAGELEEAIEIETIDDEDERRRDVLMKAVSLPARTAMAKNLATALKTISEVGTPQGKKAAAQDRAKAVGARFAAMAPPGAARSVN